MARVVAVGSPHHITQRGNQRQDVFFTDQDRAQYLKLLDKNARRYELEILGYCLMSNHVHVIGVPRHGESMARAFGRTHNDYARWLHIRRGQTGHLWQNRFFSCPLDRNHLWDALRYVECNPVRAGIVRSAVDWRWSSARAHCGVDAAPALVELDFWRNSWTVERWMEALEHGLRESALAERIREATRTGRPLGSPGFVKRLEVALGRELRPKKPGPSPQRAKGAAVSSGVA